MGVPRIKPSQFEEIPVFRETFLAHFTKDEEDAAAFRRIGVLLHVFVNEHREYWPVPDTPRPELRAVLADLRHLEGYLGLYLGPVHPFAAEIAGRVRDVADRLDRGLRNRRRF